MKGQIMTIDFDDEIEEFQDKSKDMISKISSELMEKLNQAKEIEQKIHQHEEATKQLKEALRILQEDEIPAIFTTIGISAIKLPTGETAEIVTNIHCGIPASRKDEAFDWLRENNHSEIIKNELKIRFGKKQDNVVAELKAEAEKLGLDFEQSTSVHASTLKAFVKEQMRSGVVLPADLFGIFTRKTLELKGLK